MTKNKGLAAIGLAIFGAAVREMYELKFTVNPYATHAASITWTEYQWVVGTNTGAGNYL